LLIELHFQMIKLEKFTRKENMDSLGNHILVEFFNCDLDTLNDTISIENIMVDAAKESGATIISSSFHHFSPHGVSGVVVIQESHLAIHTWPEFRFAAVDLFTCGDSIDRWAAFDKLKNSLLAENYEVIEHHRGQLDQLRQTQDFVKAGPTKTANRQREGAAQRSFWFTNRDENLALSLRLKGETCYDSTSKFQRTRIFNTFGFGKVLAIDNAIVATERDEANYHEMISHPAMFAHGNVQKVLVIGGGDGGTVREVLKHKSVKSVDLIEIDENVIKASREHLPQLSSAFKSTRLNITIGNGIEFVKTCGNKSYDLLVVDGSDPEGPSAGLFTEQFYENCFRILKSGGLLVTQSESPDFNRDVFIDLNLCLKRIFGGDKVQPLLFHIATYPAGVWSFQIAGKRANELLDIDQNFINDFVKQHQLHFYNYNIHLASLALPNYVAAMLTTI
jgi:spermidine synthase